MEREGPELKWDWNESADISDREWAETFAARFLRMNQLSEEERQREIHVMLLAASDFRDEKSVWFNKLRFKAWLALDPAAAAKLAESYAAVMRTVPGAVAWRHLLAAQHAAKEFSLEERRRLHQLFPKEIPNPPGETTANTIRHGTADPLPHRVKTGQRRWFARKNGASELRP